MACIQLSTGKPSGTCAPVTSGQKDPGDACKDETATNQCGNDGYCDGEGACRKVGADHVCATASCNKTVFTPTSTCDGKGACKSVEPLECGQAPCDIVDGCRSSCTADADCSATLGYCNATTKRCAAKKIDGEACGATNECSSGFCVDGVCCNKACKEKCMACSNSFTNEKSGVCGAVKVGTDPHDSCAVDPVNQCGTDGTCDGAGACRMNGPDQTCKAAVCDSGNYTPAATCDGRGNCGTPVARSCGAFACDARTGCQTACALDTDCTGKSYCDLTTKTCSAQKDNGKLCTANKECASGQCVDGMCCNTACTGACTACKKVYTNGTDGICASVTAGKDPYDSCADQTTTNACGNTGNCDGAGACQKVDKGKTCGDASCNGATFTPASTCDGFGVCKAGSATNCGDYQCSVTTGCLTTCTTNLDCSSATYCDTSLAKPVCTAKKKPGEACGGTDGSKCSTGKCVDGVCCTTDTCQTCYACNLNGAGTCSAVAAGAADPRGVCTASGTECGQDGKCDGNGACRYPSNTTKCGTTSCTGSSKTTGTCNNTHTCGTSTAACDGSLKCDSLGKDCLTTCTSDTNCITGYYCSSGVCQKQLAPGAACPLGKNQCASGNCVDGVCCDTACTEQCKACNLTGSVGTCKRTTGTPVSPRTACSGTDATCKGTCNGSVDACYYPTGTCGTASCANGSATTTGTCSGGSCTGVTSKACSPYVCGTNACNTSCSANSQCIGTAACVGGVCTVCASGQTVCPLACINLQTSNVHCGSCTGPACASTQQCTAGTCLYKDGQSCTSNTQCSSGKCTFFYYDSDTDGYPVQSIRTGRCGTYSTSPVAGYIPGRSDLLWDCDDGNADVSPAQTAFSNQGYENSSTGVWSYDWNCDGSEEKEVLTLVNGCTRDGDTCNPDTTTGMPRAACGAANDQAGSCMTAGETGCMMYRWTVAVNCR